MLVLRNLETVLESLFFVAFASTHLDT